MSFSSSSFEQCRGKNKCNFNDREANDETNRRHASLPHRAGESKRNFFFSSDESPTFAMDARRRLFAIDLKRIFLLVVLLGSLTTWKFVRDFRFSSFEEEFPSQFFWSIVEGNSSADVRRFSFVLQSIFVHQPNATIFLFSSTLHLDEHFLFRSFRRRGFRIHSRLADGTTINGGTFFQFDQIFLRFRRERIFVAARRSIDKSNATRRSDSSI